MKAMILAAGRGERMRPLTDNCPKPLLSVGGQPLIGWLLGALARAGITQIVINHAWLGDQIEQALADGAQWGVQIRYSRETQALETAGGIATALPLLGPDPFAVINGDIFTDFDFNALHGLATDLQARDLSGACVLVANPPQKAQGDFAISDAGLLENHGDPLFTFSGISVYRPQFFAALAAHQRAGLTPLLRAAAAKHQLGAHYFEGQWNDIGTPDRLNELNHFLHRTTR